MFYYLICLNRHSAGFILQSQNPIENLRNRGKTDTPNTHTHDP